jgi:hypothetical protein
MDFLLCALEVRGIARKPGSAGALRSVPDLPAVRRYQRQPEGQGCRHCLSRIVRSGEGSATSRQHGNQEPEEAPLVVGKIAPCDPNHICTRLTVTSMATCNNRFSKKFSSMDEAASLHLVAFGFTRYPVCLGRCSGKGPGKTTSPACPRQSNHRGGVVAARQCGA